MSSQCIVIAHFKFQISRWQYQWWSQHMLPTYIFKQLCMGWIGDLWTQKMDLLVFHWSHCPVEELYHMKIITDDSARTWLVSTFNIKRTKSQKLNICRLEVVLPYSLKPGLSREWECSWSSVKNAYVVGTASTSGAPITSDWSTILLPTKMQLILKGWR